jgi:hypothetical protein
MSSKERRDENVAAYEREYEARKREEARIAALTLEERIEEADFGECLRGILLMIAERLPPVVVEAAPVAGNRAPVAEEPAPAVIQPDPSKPLVQIAVDYGSAAGDETVLAVGRHLTSGFRYVGDVRGELAVCIAERIDWLEREIEMLRQALHAEIGDQVARRGTDRIPKGTGGYGVKLVLRKHQVSDGHHITEFCNHCGMFLDECFCGGG